ncbi:MAG: pentapeptide repeat-containing protein [Lentisphaerae bacterium]|nr:pentapeptide repeat-containing protein [Lentisphaerota bacterium]
MSDIKWQGSECTLGIVKSEGEKKNLFYKCVYLPGVFCEMFRKTDVSVTYQQYLTNSSTKERDFIMTTSTAASNRKVVSTAIIAEKAAVCTCNARNNENAFSNIEVTGLELVGKSITNAEFLYSKITDSVFENCDISYGEFKFAELENVTFTNCKLERSYFNFAILNNVKFVNCILDGSEFNFASGKVVFENSSLPGAEFNSNTLDISMQHCSVTRCEFNGCSEFAIHAEDCNLSRSEMNDSKIKGSITGCVLTDAEFNGANGNELVITLSKMRGIETRGAVGIRDTAEEDDEDDLDEEFEDIFG